MAGVSITNASDAGYPKELRDADWQKKKGTLAKTQKTGLGAVLKTGETLVKKIDVVTLDPASNPIKTMDQLEERLEAAKAEYKKSVMPLQDHMKKISKAANEAAAKLDKMKLGSGKKGAKAARDVAKTADTYAVTLKSLDLEARVAKAKSDLEKKHALAVKNLKGSIAKLATGIKTFSGEPSVAAWGAHIKQNGRSVSNCIAVLPGYKDQFWTKWQSDFKGFDESGLGLKDDDPKVNEKMMALIKNCGAQLKQIAAYKG
ncbi:MAG: hypothetical protein AAGC57_03910 [Pseudomonadota bacterium]